MKFILGTVALCSVLSAPAFAQSQAQQDRIDRVAQLVVTAPMCQRLGMTVDSEIGTKVEAAFRLETATWQLAPAIVDALKAAALRRQNAMLRVDLEATAGNARTDEQLRGINTILMGYGRTCMEATRDPIFSQVVTAPPGYDQTTAVTAFSDSLLADDRLTARPRFQWDGDDGSSLYLTVGAMTEQRTGGTLPGRTVPDGMAFVQAQDTDRFDAGLVARTPVDGLGTLALRASAMRQDHLHRFGAVVEDDRHTSLFTEASLSGESGATAWVAGAAFQSDGFRSDTFPAFDYTYNVPGLFAQIEQQASPDLTLAASGRVDFHDEFGTQFSPRLSALYRPGRWTIRASFGQGFFAPTPFVDEIDAAGLSRLEPLGDLEAETASTASLDIGYAKGHGRRISRCSAPTSITPPGLKPSPPTGCSWSISMAPPGCAAARCCYAGGRMALR